MNIRGVTKGDTIRFQLTVNENVTDWKIRAELYDDCGNSIKLANTESGGSDEEIVVDDVTNGVFTVIVPKDQTTDFDKKSHLEIEIEDENDDKFTILNGQDTIVILKSEKITWTEP